MSEPKPDGDKEAPADPGLTYKLPKFSTSIDMSGARQALAASAAMRKRIGGATKLLSTLQESTQAHKALVDSMVHKDLMASAKAVKALTESPSIRGIEHFRTQQVVEKRLGDSMRALNEHKARVDWATIQGAEATRSLVEVAASQEAVLESMDALLGSLVERQDRMIDAQLREAKSNRRWRWALFLVAAVSSAAAVVGAALGLLGILG